MIVNKDKRGPLIHIGFHKTATTWFQNIYYPSIQNMKYIPHDDVRRVFLDPKGFDAIKPDESMLEGSDIVLCHEELSGNIHNSGMNSFATMEYARRIKSVFPEARIVLFIRNQVSMVASAYKQYIKEGGTYSINRYVFHKEHARTHREAQFSLDHFNYDLKLKYYESLFGKENIYLYTFEDFCINKNQFMEKYNNDLILVSEIKPTKSVNNAYSPVIHNLARFVNLFTSESVGYKYYILHIPHLYRLSRRGLPQLNKLKIFSAKHSPEDVLGMQLASYVKNYYKETNASVAERYGLDLGRHGYL